MNIQLNDWSIKQFLSFIILIMASYIIVAFFNNVGVNSGIIKVILGILGFLILSLIPGFVIMRILRLHYLGVIRSLLFSIGLSLSYLMILGVLMSIIYPHFGVTKPLSFNSVLGTIMLSILGLLSLAWLRDNKFVSVENNYDIYTFVNSYVLLSIFILILGILGVYLVNFYDNNYVLMLFILLVSITPIIITFNKIPKKSVPLIIFFISLSLLCHVSLYSSFLVGTDIFAEYFFASSTFQNQIWNPAMLHQLNSSLSVSLLPSFFSIICGFDLVWYFKFVAPFFFALVPVGLYYMYNTSFKKELNQKEIVMAVLFTIFLWHFYIMMTGIIRQQVAELFFVLLLIIMLTEIKNEKISYNIVFVLFSVSLIFSQYSLANLFLFFIIIYMVINYLFKPDLSSLKYIGLNYVLLFLVIVFSWNMLISGGAVFKGMVLMGENIFYSFSELFGTETNVSVKIATSTSINILHIVYRYLYYFVLVCLALGGLILLRDFIYGNNKILFEKYSKKIQMLNYIHPSERTSKSYEIIALSNYSLLALYLIVPLIGFQLGFDRIFHITCLVLAPYFVLGFKSLWGILSKIKINNINKNSSTKAIAIFLSILFLFNSGFLFELCDDPFPNSNSLSFKKINDPLNIDKTEGNIYLKLRFIGQSELKSGKWFYDHNDPQIKRIYTTFGSNEFSVFGFLTPFKTVLKIKNISEIDNLHNAYFYRNLINVVGFNVQKNETGERIEIIDKKAESLNLEKINKIYCSSADEIYIIT